MTREEAIEKLTFLLDNACNYYFSDEDEDALTMAIEALKQPEIIRCKDCAYFVRGKYSDGCKKYSSFSFCPEAFCSNARRRDQ